MRTWIGTRSRRAGRPPHGDLVPQDASSPERDEIALGSETPGGRGTDHESRTAVWRCSAARRSHAPAGAAGRGLLEERAAA